MVIAIGADHGGLEYKQEIIKSFDSKYDFIDVGAYKLDNEDNYTEFSFKIGELISNKKADFGVMICRTGAGASIALNKVSGVRCAVITDLKNAKLAREKNDINAVAFGADNISLKKACDILKLCLNTQFEKGRHLRRVKEIEKYEQEHITKK